MIDPRPDPAVRYRLSDHCLEDGRVAVALDLHVVARRTARGTWVMRDPASPPLPPAPTDDEWDRGPRCLYRFVLDGRGKRFAHETVGWAVESFVARKRSQMSIARASAARAEAALWALYADLGSGVYPQIGGAP